MALPFGFTFLEPGLSIEKILNATLCCFRPDASIYPKPLGRKPPPHLQQVFYVSFYQ